MKCQYCSATLKPQIEKDGHTYMICEHCGARIIEGKSFLFGDKVSIISWENYDKYKKQ